MRVTSASLHTTALQDLQRAQSQLLTAQKQAGSENRADDLAGFGREASSLISARTYLSQTQAFVAVNKETDARLNTQAVAFSLLEQSAQDLQSAVAEAIGMDRGDELMERVRQAFESAVGALNTTHAGKFVFGGIREDQPPFVANSLADVEGAAAIDDLFVNAERKAEVRIDVTSTVTIAPLADEIGRDFVAAVRRMTEFENNFGPVTGNFTAAARNELQSILGDITSAVQSVISERSKNGGVQERVSRITQRNEEQAIYFNNMVADIQEVDLAEVATKISSAQLQLQASSQIYGQLSRLSLLDYLR
jgi:flagellar hook-associated protein 3 FlgL